MLESAIQPLTRNLNQESIDLLIHSWSKAQSYPAYRLQAKQRSVSERVFTQVHDKLNQHTKNTLL